MKFVCLIFQKPVDVVQSFKDSGKRRPGLFDLVLSGHKEHYPLARFSSPSQIKPNAAESLSKSRTRVPMCDNRLREPDDMEACGI
jgi:hypothetical protein